MTVAAEFAEIPAAVENPFDDVSVGDCCYDAVIWAAEEGITNGTSAEAFSPDAECTRAQIVTFLMRMMTYFTEAD